MVAKTLDILKGPRHTPEAHLSEEPLEGLISEHVVTNDRPHGSATKSHHVGVRDAGLRGNGNAWIEEVSRNLLSRSVAHTAVVDPLVRLDRGGVDHRVHVTGTARYLDVRVADY